MMKNKFIVLGILFTFFGVAKMDAQINLGEKAIGALQKGVTSFTLTNEDAAKLSKEAVDKLDAEHVVAAATDPYAVRTKQSFWKTH
jgi:putative metalloprotease